jgi:hypothetical protein
MCRNVFFYCGLSLSLFLNSKSLLLLHESIKINDEKKTIFKNYVLLTISTSMYYFFANKITS